MKYNHEQWWQKRQQAIEGINLALMGDDEAHFEAAMEIALADFTDEEIAHLISTLRTEQHGIESTISAIKSYRHLEESTAP